MMQRGDGLVFGTEATMWMPLGEAAVGGDLVHLLVIAHLKNDRKEIQAIRARGFTDLLLGRQKLFGKRGEGMRGHDKSYASGDAVSSAAAQLSLPVKIGNVGGTSDNSEAAADTA